MTTRYRFVATDLDGTLLRDDMTVSRRNRAVLRRLAGQGIRHVIVTGRPASGCTAIFEAVDYHGLAVCSQGAQIYDFSAHRLIASSQIDRRVARSVTDLLRRRLGAVSFAAVTCGLAGRLVAEEGFARPGEVNSYAACVSRRLWAEPVERVLVRHPLLGDDELARAVARICGRSVGVVQSAPGHVELVPPGTDKGAGLSRLASIVGIDPGAVIAFGDMPNDIPMLRWSGYPVAMGNCHPALLEVACEVAPPNTEHGVAVVLERILGAPARAR